MSADEDIGTMVGRVLIGGVIVIIAIVVFTVWAWHHLRIV